MACCTQAKGAGQVKAGADAHLDHRLPRVHLGVGAVAVEAHVPLDHKLHHERLLQDCAVHHLSLHCHLHLEPLAVRLSPNEPRVHELDLLQPFHTFDTEREQLLALQIGWHPVMRRLQVPPAVLAVGDRHVLLDAFRDVHLVAQALDAHVRWIRLDVDAAEAAEDVTLRCCRHEGGGRHGAGRA